MQIQIKEVYKNWKELADYNKVVLFGCIAILSILSGAFLQKLLPEKEIIQYQYSGLDIYYNLGFNACTIIFFVSLLLLTFYGGIIHGKKSFNKIHLIQGDNMNEISTKTKKKDPNKKESTEVPTT